MDRGASLQTFLSATFADISGKFKEFNAAVTDFSTDEASIKTMINSVFTCWEEINGIMDQFKTELSKVSVQI